LEIGWIPMEKKLALAISFFALVNISIIVLSLAVVGKFLRLSKSGVVPFDLPLLGFGAGIAIILVFFGAARVTLKRRRE
jgi:hypothetical protein|tara:strand:+ start:190 stop:426 length:237 start_codon:yes stop_codon:yes gene_type:complete